MKPDIGEIEFSHEPQDIQDAWVRWASANSCRPVPEIGTMMIFVRQHQWQRTVSALDLWEMVKYYEKTLTHELWEACKMILRKKIRENKT